MYLLDFMGYGCTILRAWGAFGLQCQQYRCGRTYLFLKKYYINIIITCR
eukprot:SAG31_NODE_15369_length_758_cov_1.335357_1_plen_49_part_00